MDHLPLRRNPVLDPIQVPYQCTEPYDGKPMLGYPARHGWQILYSPAEITYLHHGEKAADEDFEPFLQNYLYFGLLYEAFGNLCDLSDFLHKNEDSGAVLVTTAPLENLLVHLVSEWKQALESQDSHQVQWWSNLGKITQHIWTIALNTEKRLYETVVDPRIWLSIAELSTTVEEAVRDVFTDLDMEVPKSMFFSAWRLPTNPPIGLFLVDAMSKKGWCPIDTRCIDLTTSKPGTLYYIANLPPPRAHANHSKCSRDRCVEMTINKRYRTKHDDLCTNTDCKEFENTIDVIRILEGDDIPLIVASPNRTEKKDLLFTIVENSPTVDFVAISHVWAEGLGNPHANSLPTCSMQCISTLAGRLPFNSQKTPMPFWIDTICVPIKPEHMRIRAMNRLRRPYQDAKHVLVLDSYLYTQDSASLSCLEILARVLCCIWSRRLWTFQEGRLAKNLWFQFADRAVTMEEVFLGIEPTLSSSAIITEMKVAYRGSNPVRNIAVHMNIEKIKREYRPEPTVRDMRESLQARAVSVPSDEALCLFCSMNLDMALVTDLAPEERMPRFWGLVDKIPLGLVFSTAEDKLEQPGLRWAPKSFMGNLESRHWYIEQSLEPRVDGFPTPEGLHMQAPAFLFSPNLLRHEGSFDILLTDQWLPLRDENGIWYFIEMLNYWNQSRKGDPGAKEQLAILLVQSPGTMLNDCASGDTSSFAPGIEGVIGVVTQNENENAEEASVKQIRIYRHALLHRFSEASQIYHRVISECVEEFVLLALNWKDAEGDKDGDEANLSEVAHNDDGLFEETVQDLVLGERKKSDSPLETCKEDERHKKETPETFELTDERRVTCQAFGTGYAQYNPEAREISLAYARKGGLTSEQAFEKFGAHARFQLQMRLRDRIQSVPQTQAWCID